MKDQTGLCSLFLSVFCAEEFDKETGQILSGMDKLPPDLKQYVKEDNELFDKEIEEWDTLQARKAQQESWLWSLQLQMPQQHLAPPLHPLPLSP